MKYNSNFSQKLPKRRENLKDVGIDGNILK
jgi:hypothetical protein